MEVSRLRNDATDWGLRHWAGHARKEARPCARGSLRKPARNPVRSDHRNDRGKDSECPGRHTAIRERVRTVTKFQ